MDSPFFPGQQVQKKPEPKQPSQDTLSMAIAQTNRRMRVLEERLDTLRDHVELIDENLMEKHKANTAEIKRIQSQLREVQNEIKEVKEMFNRLAKRMEAFASKDKLKVLERYINIWNPMEYMTRKDVERIMDEKLKETKKKDIKK